MAYLIDIQTSFPSNYYNQQELVAKLAKAWDGKLRNTSRIESIHKNVLVEGRHLALPLERYFEFKNFDEKNDEFINISVNLAKNAIERLLLNNNISAEKISSLWSNTVTGFAIPSLEARVMNLLPFSPKTKRIPIMGLGCMAGAAGINRVADYLKGYPKEAVIFFSVELCSLTVQMNDISAANIVSTGLFGDGAAAVLMVGDEHPLKDKAKLKWCASESVFFKDSETVMGWQVGSEGLKIILSKSVPDVTKNELPGPLKAFLTDNQLALSDIDTFFAHPGGPKVLSAMEEVLDLPQGGLKHSWESLKLNGNMSSVSVLDIFKRTIENKDPELSGRNALSLAMGPAFSAELGLFKWC